MKPRYQVSRKGLELIKTFEGYRRASARLADGRWTIGYGHTKSARPGVEVSEADAEGLLLYDLIEVSAELNRLIYTPLTQNQFDALASFAFNLGTEAFRTSGVLRRINEGAMLQAAYALDMWRKADFEGERIVLDALIRRRAAEKALFLTPTDGYVPAPTPILAPRVDYDAAGAQPRQLPLNLVVTLEGDVAEAHQEASLDPGPASGAPATTAAVDAVTERLQTLLPDADPVAAIDPSIDPLIAPGLEMTDPAEVDVMLSPLTPAEDQPGAPVIHAPDLETEFEVADIRVGPMGVERRKKHRQFRLIPYGPLFGLGLLFFIGGIVWQLMEKDALGLGVALLGALLLAVSIYYLLQQIDDDSAKTPSPGA